ALCPSELGHVERLEEDRLPRAGLAGDDVEPGLERQLELLDEREVADADRAQHPPPSPTGRPSRAWSAARRSRSGPASARARPASAPGAPRSRRRRPAVCPPARRWSEARPPRRARSRAG